jgi:predicted CxxxxCH...CXXCH cytochrome family protein
VRFAGLATTGGRRATYDPTTKTCRGTYCHESRGGVEIAPQWTGVLTTGCAACHASPPPAPHSQSATCSGTTCHEGRTDALVLTAKGRADHVDGIIERD